MLNLTFYVPLTFFEIQYVGNAPFPLTNIFPLNVQQYPGSPVTESVTISVALQIQSNIQSSIYVHQIKMM